jgi:serine/threonine-protein kinase HipA
LLPDNEGVLERWARTFHASAANSFALLAHVGEDCAGAVQLVRPDRVEPVLAGEGHVEWLDDADVAEHIALLKRDPTAWHTNHDGQFSLAGAQAKTALHRDPATGRWGVPVGAQPTTHILKPAVTGFDDHDLNEHLCLTAARAIGMSAAVTSVESIGPERVIVVERYDRVIHNGAVHRVHQEDMCQALGVRPETKYQNEGGPTPENIIELLRRYVAPATAAAVAVDRFVDALAFNWVVGGTDAHAKNYAVLLSRSQVRLSPLYDIASVLPYETFHLPKVRMAMKIGGRYGLLETAGRHWRRFAAGNGLDPDRLIERIDGIAAALPDAVATAASVDAVKALGSPLAGRLVDQVAARSAACREQLLQ